MTIQAHHGYFGMFDNGQVEGAYPNGARVRKVRSEPGDSQPIGTLGTVLGSIDPLMTRGVAYFVEWDSMPHHAVLVVAWKLLIQQRDAA